MKAQVKKTLKGTRTSAVKSLQATVKKLQELPTKNFDYHTYVAKFDTQTKFGTVCCVVGWYPQWFKDSKIKYNSEHMPFEPLYAKETVDDALQKYHNLNDDVIGTLFYGISLWIGNKRFRAKNGLDSSKSEVIAHFKKIIKLLESGKLDNTLLKPKLK
jgi:hypothetical protein